MQKQKWPPYENSYCIKQDRGKIATREIHDNFIREKIDSDLADFVKTSLARDILNSGEKIPDGFIFLRDCLPNPHEGRLKRFVRFRVLN